MGRRRETIVLSGQTASPRASDPLCWDTEGPGMSDGGPVWTQVLGARQREARLEASQWHWPPVVRERRRGNPAARPQRGTRAEAF